MSNQNKIFLFTVTVLLFTGICFAQDENIQNDQMQVWMEYMTPGAMHELLASGVGEWTTVSKFWMDPDGEPMVTEGSGTTEMILGGRYEKSIHTSNVMGMPSEGMWLMGYDNATEEFTAIWIDNLGTGTAIAKGTYDESTNSINLIGTMVDPMTGEYMDFREVRTFVDENNQLLEMYMTYNGQEFKTMEIEFTRK
jgi:hypothetical protein